MRRSRSFPVVGISLCAALALPGYRAGERAGTVAGWSCSRRNFPLLPSGTPYAEGYAAGCTVAYTYSYKKFRSLKACALRHGQAPPGPITR